MNTNIRRPIGRAAGSLAAGLLALLAAPVSGQGAETPAAQPDPGVQDPEREPTRFETAAERVRRQLEESLAEYERVQNEIANETLPLSRMLSALQAELSALRQRYQDMVRNRDTSSLERTRVADEVKVHEETTAYISGLLVEYLANFESRLHIAEDQRYRDVIEQAHAAEDNPNLVGMAAFEQQLALMSASLDRLEEAIGGTRFDGTALSGLVREGTFVVVGPSAVFRSNDGAHVGTVEAGVRAVGPAVFPFGDPQIAAAASSLVQNGAGDLPVDTTLGKALEVEATEVTLLDEFEKGGVVMVPILALASAALLVALFKWLTMLAVRRPSRAQVRSLLDAVAARDPSRAESEAATLKGPVGRMLAAGVAHLREPRELIEEVMYETVLATRLELQRMLPFVAISAAAAPLLGLLGTVTGIINTFKQITVSGTGDVKTLSGGISEALITTKYGLIVAIPSLLLHAWLSRKARGVVGDMEEAAVAFANQVGKTPLVERRAPAVPAATAPVSGPTREAELTPAQAGGATREQVKQILSDLLEPVVTRNLESQRERSTTGGAGGGDPSASGNRPQVAARGQA